MQTPDQNDLKLGILVVLHSLMKPTDFGFKRSRVLGTGSASLHIFKLAEPRMKSLYHCQYLLSLWTCISTESTF